MKRYSSIMQNKHHLHVAWTFRFLAILSVTWFPSGITARMSGSYLQRQKDTAFIANELSVTIYF
jgi:hypothetical protein